MSKATNQVTKYASRQLIIAIAQNYKAIGCGCGQLYALRNDDSQAYFGRKLYRDSLHILAQEGILKYNDDFTYSIADAK